jgi:predicted nucleic acid-binding Zn ribbon protein
MPYLTVTGLIFAGIEPEKGRADLKIYTGPRASGESAHVILIRLFLISALICVICGETSPPGEAGPLCEAIFAQTAKKRVKINRIRLFFIPITILIF